MRDHETRRTGGAERGGTPGGGAARRTGAERARDEYAGAFARVRLVRAWVAVVAALVAMLYAYVALLERVLR